MYYLRFLTILVCLLIVQPALGAHFLEPIGTEITRIPPEGKFFMQSGISLFQEDAAGGVQLDKVSAPIGIELGISKNTQINFEADLSFKQERIVGGALVNRDGADEIGFGIRHRFRQEADHGDEMAFEVEFAPSAERHGANEMKFLFLWGGHIFDGDHLFANVGVKFETENGENDSKRTFLYNVAYLHNLNEQYIFGIESNAKVNAGRTGDRTVLTLRPQLIWRPTSSNYAVKFGVGFGMTHNDPELDGSLLISRMF